MTAHTRTRHTYSWFLSVLTAVLCAVFVRPVLAQTFRFDNGFSTSSSGLVFEYSRSTPAVSEGGVLLGPDQPRFTRRPHLLCGAPIVRTDTPISTALGGTFMSAASGVGPDGTGDLLLVYIGDPAKVQLRRLNPDGSYVLVFQKDTAYASGPNNILKGEIADRNAEGIRYAPTMAFSICHGLVVACCQVYTLSGGEWVRVRTAVCYWDMAAPQLGWRAVDIGIAANTQVGKNRGSPFQMSGYHVLDEGPVLRAWFPFSDYVLNNQPVSGGMPPLYSDTGVFYLINAVRPAVGQPWVVGPLAPVYSPPPRTVTPLTMILGQHAHPPYVERFGAHGLRLVCPLGDSWARNRVAVAYRSDEAYAASPWAVIENMHGSSGTEFDMAVGLGNQFVGSAPLGTPDLPLGHVVGSDETTVMLARAAAVDNATDCLNFTRLYGQPTSSYNHAYAPARVYGWNTFHIASASPESGGPYVAQVLPGMQAGWQFDTTVTRLLFSHDGLTWGQAWAPQDVQPWPPKIAGGRIFAGSPDRSRAYGLRSIPIPTTHGASPLVVGDGGVNLLKLGENGASPVGVDAGNRVTLVTKGALAARGIPMPPAAGQVYECVVGAQLPVASSRRVGTWQLTSATGMRPTYPHYTISAKVRVWLYPLPWNGAAQPWADSMQAFFSLGRFDPAFPVNPLGGAREEFIVGAIQTVGDAVGGWLPLTLDTDSSRWSAEIGRILPAASSQPFALGLRVRTDSNVPVNPCAFLIAFESVQQGAGASWGVPPAAAGPFDQDHAAVTGFACGPEWTIRLAGEVPDDAWDQTLEPSQVAVPLTLCTLQQDDENHIQLQADVAGRAINIITTVGGVATTIPLTPAGSFQGRERFCFLRGSPVLLSVSRRGEKLSMLASVGGTMIAKADISNADIRPVRIGFANAKGMHPAAMHWYGGRVDAAIGISSQDAADSLADLRFLTDP